MPTLWMCAAATGTYALTAAAVLVSRARYERRRRIAAQLERDIVDRSAPQARWALERCRLGMLVQIAAEAPLSRPSEQALACVLFTRLGTPDFRRPTRLDRNGRRRVAALRALAVSGRNEVWACFADALACGGPDVSAAVITMLGRIPDRRAAMLLVDALRSDRHARSRVATALDAFPMAIDDLLSPLLAADDPYDRYWGTLLMRRYPDRAGLERQLTVLARDRESLVRRAAVETIGVAGFRTAAADVASLTRDPVGYVRAHAARALGQLGAVDHTADVLALMGDREWIVRAAAKQSLEAMGPTIAPAVARLLWDSDRFARDGAAEVLQSIGGQATAH